MGPLVEISRTVFAVGSTRETLENERRASTQSSASPPRRSGRDSSGVENIFGTRRREQGHAAGIISHRFAARFLESSLYPGGRERIFFARAHRQFPRRRDSRQCSLSLAVNDDREIWNDYKKLRAQLSNQAERIAAARLFAGDPRQRDFVRSLVGQQGLLQIYEDFCLRDASDCASCPLPEQLRRW